MELEDKQHNHILLQYQATAMADVWESMSFYESLDLIERAFKERHNVEINTYQGQQIVFNFTHAREYFRSAKEAQLYVKPLILYYGVLSLCRGLILFLNPSMLETGLHEGHGVCAKGWHDRLSEKTGGIRNIPDLKIEIAANGTFAEFCDATANTEIISTFWHGPTDRFNWKKKGHIDTKTNPTFTIKQILAHIPELKDAYERIFKEFSSCYRATVMGLSSLDQTNIDIHKSRLGLPKEDDLRKQFGWDSDIQMVQTVDHYYDNTDCWFIWFKHATDDERIAILPPIKNDQEGDIYLVAPIENSINLSSISWLFLISFALGALVRYHPTTWTLLVTKATGDNSMPIMLSAINLIEARCPALVLRELEKVEFY